MAVDTPAKIAILGAGPIGLEAALYARYLGYEVEIFESDQCAAARRAKWGHVPMLAPWRELVSPLGMKMLRNQDEQRTFPKDDALVTAREWVERYFQPLAESDLIVDHVRLGTTVVRIGKVEISKTDRPSGEFDRGSWDFRILVRTSDGAEHLSTADVVFDCTGVIALPLGQGGVRAVGESQLASSIEYGVPKSEAVAGKTVLLVGDDPLAAISIDVLLASGAKITWFTRRERDESGPLAATENAPAELRRLIAQANAAATDGRIDWRPETWAEKVSLDTSIGRYRVEFGGAGEGSVDCALIASNNGFRPDWSMCEELQLDVCPTTGSPRCEAGGIVTSEPNFYVLGSKRFGRAPGYAHRDGLNHIRDAFKVIGDRADLDLYRAMER